MKLFRLSQLTIEYLLFAQEELVTNVTTLTRKYSSKKRELMKKRRELAILQESTSHLKTQVKVKRENIHTLESLLKDAAIKNRKKSNYFSYLLSILLYYIVLS